MAADFTGCRKRLQWIDHALRAMDEDFRMWLLEANPHPITVEYQPEADVHVFRLGSQSPPERFGIVAGNIVHQIRATLDNLVWQLVIANGEEPTGGMGGNAFPVVRELKGNQTFADNTRKSLAGVHPDHVAFIEGLQPYQNPEWGPGRHPVALLADLSNTDKHQVLQIVTAEQPDVEPLDLGVHFHAPEGVTIVEAGDFARVSRYPGAIIGWAHFSPSGFHPNVKMDAAMWATLRFADYGLPVIGALETLYAVVESVEVLLQQHIDNSVPLPAIRLDQPTVGFLVSTIKGARRNYSVP